MALKIGIDLGGTKTEIVVLNHDLQPIYRRRVPSRSQHYDDILETIVSLVRDAEAKCGCGASVGIGIPGSISPVTGLIRNANTVCLNGHAFLADIESRLQREVRIDNDANCFTWSEVLSGAAQDFAVVFGIIIGTGTGGGLVVNGQLINGAHGIGGEWGHNPLPWLDAADHASDCYCGKIGCIETFLSGPGMSRNYQARFDEMRSSREIVSAADKNDASCSSMMSIYYDQMARALAHVINILDPNAIVLGGGMSNITSIYTEVPRRLPDYVFSDFVETPVLAAQHGDASGVFGAALLWEIP